MILLFIFCATVSKTEPIETHNVFVWERREAELDSIIRDRAAALRPIIPADG